MPPTPPPTDVGQRVLGHLRTADRLLAAAAGTLEVHDDAGPDHIDRYAEPHDVPTESESHAAAGDVAKAYGEFRHAAELLGATANDDFADLRAWGAEVPTFDEPKGLLRLAPDEHTLRAADTLYTQIRILFARIRDADPKLASHVQPLPDWGTLVFDQRDRSGSRAARVVLAVLIAAAAILMWATMR